MMLLGWALLVACDTTDNTETDNTEDSDLGADTGAVADSGFADDSDGTDDLDDSEDTDVTADDTSGVFNGVFIRLSDPLDEPEYYCLDVPGFGDGVQLEDALTAHTCKAFGSEDQTWDLTLPGMIEVPSYDLCIHRSGDALMLGDCASAAAFQFDGRLMVDGLCVTVGAESEPAGGVSHLVRSLSIQDCDTVDSERSTWEIWAE